MPRRSPDPEPDDLPSLTAAGWRPVPAAAAAAGVSVSVLRKRQRAGRLTVREVPGAGRRLLLVHPDDVERIAAEVAAERERVADSATRTGLPAPVAAGALEEAQERAARAEGEAEALRDAVSRAEQRAEQAEVVAREAVARAEAAEARLAVVEPLARGLTAREQEVHDRLVGVLDRVAAAPLAVTEQGGPRRRRALGWRRTEG